MESKKELFELLSAYKNSKIFWLRAYNFYNTNIENVFICAWEIAKALGAEVDTEAKTDEILKQFLNFE
jgi:iron complex transport system substrate-binding protein